MAEATHASSASHVLIVKLGAIGDVVMVLPAAYALHRAGHAIDWVCGRAVLPLLVLYPWIHPIPVDERALLKGAARARIAELRRLWRSLARRRYGLVAILYYDRRYRALTLPVRAGRTLLLSNAQRERRLLPGRHHTDEFARILLGRCDGLEPRSLAPVEVSPQSLPESPLPRASRPRVVLAPAGARNLMADDALRRWPAEHYVELTHRLLAEQIEVVLIGGADDDWVRTQFQSLAATDLIGRLALPETLALLDASDVLITHDTGPLHLAGITRVGVIGIFGPTDPRGRLPQRAGTVALWGGEGFACRPCYDGRNFAPCTANDCMRQIKPGMVFDQTLAMLAERAKGVLAPPRVLTPVSTVPAAWLQIGGLVPDAR